MPIYIKIIGILALIACYSSICNAQLIDSSELRPVYKVSYEYSQSLTSETLTLNCARINFDDQYQGWPQKISVSVENRSGIYIMGILYIQKNNKFYNNIYVVHIEDIHMLEAVHNFRIGSYCVFIRSVQIGG